MIWRNWLPTLQQMSDAVQMRRHAYTSITMQQALGLVVLMGLLAGLLPFIRNWTAAVEMGAAVPLARAAQQSIVLRDRFADWFIGVPGVEPALFADFYLTLAGLDQPFPPWLAGGVSALGLWLAWPLRWLSLWIVYGSLVVAVDKAFGATMTLQRFFAATGYAAVPLLLTGFEPIPCLGSLAVFIGTIWSIAVFVRANQDVTGFSLLRAAVAVFLPLALLSALALFLLGFLLFSMLLTIL